MREKAKTATGREVLCSRGSSVPTAPESNFSASLALGLGGKSLATHQDGGKQPNTSESKLVVPPVCLQCFMSSQLEGGKPALRGTGPEESQRLQTWSPCFLDVK